MLTGGSPELLGPTEALDVLKTEFSRVATAETWVTRSAVPSLAVCGIGGNLGVNIVGLGLRGRCADTLEDVVGVVDDVQQMGNDASLELGFGAAQHLLAGLVGG